MKSKLRTGTCTFFVGFDDIRSRCLYLSVISALMPTQPSPQHHEHCRSMAAASAAVFPTDF